MTIYMIFKHIIHVYIFQVFSDYYNLIQNTYSFFFDLETNSHFLNNTYAVPNWKFKTLNNWEYFLYVEKGLWNDYWIFGGILTNKPPLTKICNMIQTLIVAAAGVRQLPRPLHDTKARNTELWMLKRADIFVVKKYPPSGG